jgi:small subunit ribosomal protein S8
MSLVNAPVQDLLIRIKNAYMARRMRVENVVYSKFKAEVLSLLKMYRFVSGFAIREEGSKKFLDIDLYVTGDMNEDVPVVTLYSKPSKRRYVGWKEIRPVA